MARATKVGPAWPGVVDETLEVAGRRVRVLRAPAQPGAEGGTPQLLVHGLGASAVTWVEVMPGLSARGPVVAVDLPGFGQTRAAAEDELTVDSYVAFVLQVADALGWSRLDLHGNSMGGLIATLLAAQQPERVARLVLVSPALPPSHPLRLLMPARATIDGMAPIVASSISATALGLVGAGAALDERRNRHLLRLIFTDPDGVRPELIDLMAREFADPDADLAAGRRRACGPPCSRSPPCGPTPAASCAPSPPSRPPPSSSAAPPTRSCPPRSCARSSAPAPTGPATSSTTAATR